MRTLKHDKIKVKDSEYISNALGISEERIQELKKLNGKILERYSKKELKSKADIIAELVNTVEYNSTIELAFMMYQTTTTIAEADKVHEIGHIIGHFTKQDPHIAGMEYAMSIYDKKDKKESKADDSEELKGIRISISKN